MARNNVLLPVLGGIALVGLAAFFMLRGGDVAQGDAAVDVLRQDSAATSAEGARKLVVPAAERAERPDALPASITPMAAAVSTDKPALPESFRLALGALTGRVLDAADAPVPGMTVELVGGRKSMVLLPRDALLAEGGLDFNPIVGSAVTGDDGRFRLADLEPRTFGGLILDPGGPRALLHVLDISPVSGQEKDLGDIRLPATATLKGRLVDERGAAIAGARVRATELPMAGIPGMEFVIGSVADFRTGGAVLIPSSAQTLDHDVVFAPPANLMRLEKHLPLPTTYTDATGAFVLSGVIPGLVLFAADDGVHLPLVKESVPTGAAGGERDLGALVMGDGVTLRGRVMNDKGEPVAGAEVLTGNALGVVPAALLKGPARSDAEGRFTVKGLRDALVWTAARTDRRKEYSAFSTEDLSREFVITLPAPRTLTVTVTDEKGLMVRDARFFGRIIEESEIPDFLVPPRPLDGQVTTDDKQPGVYTLSDLQPGKWELAVNAPGFGLERAESDLNAGDGSVEVRLVAGRALLVKVVRKSDGTPVEHALVAAYQSKDESPDTAVRTGLDGRARFTALRPGDVNLMVTHPALAITEQKALVPGGDSAGGAEVQEVLVELMAGSTILGHVLENGGPPLEPLMIVLAPPRDGLGDSEIPRVTISDLDGNFRFDQVEGGTANLEARSRNDLQSGLMLFETFFNSPLAEASVEVPASSEVQATLVIGAALAEVDSGYLAGRLVVNGRAAEGWKVRSFGEIRRTAVVDNGGRFDLGRIAAGDVRLAFSAPGTSLMEGSTDTQEVALAKDEHKFVELSFSTGGIRGRVSSAQDGRGIPGVKVRAVADGQDGNWFRQAGGVSGPDGSFSIETISAGKYRISARADGFANSSSEPFTVTELQVVSGIELRLAKALHAEGTLTLSSGEKPSWMWLVATSADGTTRDTAQVDRKTGKFSFDGLAPGAWTLTLATDLDDDLAPLEMSFDRDVTGLELVFEPAPIPEDAVEAAQSDGVIIVNTFESGK